VLEPLLHKFYAASITIGIDGSMLVASTHERALSWLALFCFIAIMSLVIWYIWRKKHLGKVAMVFFVITLITSILTIPSVRNEYIHVAPGALTIETGAWYRHSSIVLQMSNIKNIRESHDNNLLPGNLIGDPNVTWHITWQDGQSRIFNLNDFFNAHRMVVAYYYKDRGFWLERLEDQKLPHL